MMFEAAAQAGKRLAFHAKWLEPTGPGKEQPQQHLHQPLAQPQQQAAPATDDGW